MVQSSPTDKLKKYYATGVTRDIRFRIDALRRLQQGILESETEIYRALEKDLHKSEGESYLSEIGLVLGEIRDHIRHLGRWSRDQRVKTPLFLLPSRSRIMYEPYGVVLIIAPWNYPFQLIMMPLIGAIAAGNCVVLKPSPAAPVVSEVIAKIIHRVFESRYVDVFLGEGDVVDNLLKERWDYIFYTGGPRFGRQVMETAARQLIPVTLELGGKSPCIIGEHCDLEIAARRIAWGKFLNAGQTCVAPDYVLIPHNLKEKFISQMQQAIARFWGENPLESPDYARIVHQPATIRLVKLMQSSGKIVHGGRFDTSERYIEPTILDDVDANSLIMQEEIFGPVLPVIGYEHIEEAVNFVNGREKPLALYYFGREKDGERVIRSTSSGGGCINDTISHLANNRLPFGGVGESGIGKYHGKTSFELFSNRRSILSSYLWIDIPLRYPPYKLKWIKKFIN